MDKGVIISGIGHAGLILWVLLGGLLLRPKDAPEIAATEVSLISNAEFEAILAASPLAPAPDPAQTEVATPAPPTAETPPPVPESEAAPVVVVPAPKPETVPDVAPQPDVAEVAPLPVPEAPEVAPQPPAPLVADIAPVLAPESAARPRPRPAVRVAPTPAPTPAPDALPDVAATPAVTPDAASPAEVVVEELPETAPEEAGDVLQTEANILEPLAPASSVRPRPRPARTAAVVTPDKPAAKPPAQAQVEVPRDAIADAVAAAVAEATPVLGAAGLYASAPSGPPMTAGEKDALRVAVQACWNVGSLSSEALNVTVTVAVTVAESGVPEAGSISMIGFEGGSEASARQAYEAARRAIIRCGATGFKLPAEKYDQWRSIEMVFNPERMRIK